ncbi:hypothetical protein [Streptomyces sp. NPDC001621]|uniref:hypothetical protein n=1 Tax=Streptomyces sp. NPDC001621 TaxID=3364594 RepID=UPI0036877048
MTHLSEQSAAVPAARVDTDQVRRTVKAVLGERRIGRPDLGSMEQHAHVAGLLRGQLALLLAAVGAQAPQMGGVTLATAEHVIACTDDALRVETAKSRTPDHLHDMAILARALLTLHELSAHARPLSSSART